MDIEDDDLFAVFDSDGSKAATSGAASRLLHKDKKDEEEEEEEVMAKSTPIKFDSGQLVAEICGSNSKRTKSQDDDSVNDVVKKVKTDSEDTVVTLMTGLSDKEIERTLKGESDWETQERPAINLSFAKLP